MKQTNLYQTASLLRSNLVSSSIVRRMSFAGEKKQRNKGITGSVDDFNKKYFLGEVLGKGAFATAMKIQEYGTGDLFVVKIPNEESRHRDVAAEEKEVLLHQSLVHPNILDAPEIYHDPIKSVHYLVMQYAKGGDLEKYILCRPDFKLQENEAWFVSREILKGLEFLHSKKIMHRDLKLDNILLLDDGLTRVAISDFGMARKAKLFKIYGDRYCYGAELYHAPEIRCGGAQTKKSDVWAVGIMMFMMLCGHHPTGVPLPLLRQGKKPDEFAGEVRQRFATEEALNRVMLDNFLIHHWMFSTTKMGYRELTSDTTTFVDTLLSFESKDRPSTKKLLKNPWFLQQPLPEV